MMMMYLVSVERGNTTMLPCTVASAVAVQSGSRANSSLPRNTLL